MMLWVMSMKPGRVLNVVLVWAVILVNLSLLVSSGTTPLKKRSLVILGKTGGVDLEEPGDQQPKMRLPTKRTFCNAFTGCGRKRSDGSMPIQPPSKDYEYEGPTNDPSVDDSVVDDIVRDVLAEARLWEALQARNVIRSPFRRQPGFFPRQKRAPDSEDEDKND